jgi:multiple sugar transport system permease protein
MALPQSLSTTRAARTRTGNLRAVLINRLLDLLLIVLIFFMIAPLIYMVVSSLKSSAEFTNSTSFFPQQWRWSNYPEMWRAADFGLYFRNSLIVCLTTTVVATFFAALTGYALTRFRFPGADIYGLSVLGTQLIPGTLFFIPLYLTFLWIRTTFGLPLIGTNFGGIVLYIGFFIPVSLWILRGFFAAIPIDLEEAAMIDGATRFQAFWRIIMPLAGPGIVSTAIYIFLSAWDELFFASILRVRTVPFGLLLFSGVQSAQVRYDLIMAGAVVSTLPIIILFLLLQRRLVEGLTAGAVK